MSNNRKKPNLPKNLSGNISNSVEKEVNSHTQQLMGNLSDEEYERELETSAEAFKRMQERRKNSASAQENEEDEEEDEDEDEEDEDEDNDNYETSDIDEDEKNGTLSFLKNLVKKVGLKTLIATGLSFGSITAISTLLIGMYRVHYTGELEFKGIGGEYQSLSFEKMNFASFNEKGDFQLSGLTKENKLAKTFYTFYSDNSYYAVVEDSKKYSNPDDAYKRENLLTPKELREQYPQIEDTEGREKLFQLNPDVLYSLDRYLHKDRALYPQQFIKPVYYEESQQKFDLKSLTDNNGNIVAKSQSFDSDGKVKFNSDGSLKKEYGVWDYGFASVLHYKEFQVPEREIVNSLGRTIVHVSTDDNGVSSNINQEVSQTQIDKVQSGTTPPEANIGGTFDKGLRSEPAYAIDKAVTAGGSIKSNITQRWQEKSGSRVTFTKESYITEQEPYIVEVPDYLTDENGQFILDENGNKIENGTKQETRYKTYTYKVVDTYEKYMEEYLPFYEGDPDTSDLVGSKYFRDYIYNYSTYLPRDVPNKLDYSVLEKEGITELLSDDTPGSISNSVMGPVSGETFPAEFTAYYASNDPMQGGFVDAMGNKLDYTKNTCAGPIKRKYPNSKLDFNSKIVINGTGTEKDNTTCTITDTGGAIVLKPDGTYRIDILMKDRTTAYAFGRRKGTITILSNGSAVANSGSSAPNTLRTVLSNTRTSSNPLMLNQGGNAVTNYGMSMDDYAKARVPKACDSGNCSVANYREHVEPDAFKDKVGDLRHLRLDIYRPVDEQAFAQKFAEKFDKKMAPYGQALIEACKQKNIDVLAKTAQFALESGWGRRAIIGTVGGKTYYNFSGIGANDGNAYQGGLNYAVRKGWDSPEKGMIGAIEFLADNYIHSPEYKQNTLFKISMPWKSPNEHWYASNPDYAYSLASIMKDWTHLYSPGATFYYDLPTFDPTKPVGTIEGAGHGAQAGGGGTSPIGAFNSYLATNWTQFEQKKPELFPWTADLDSKLDLERKGSYENLKNIELTPKNPIKYTPKLTKTDVEIVLNMMFALNQGNYLSKYDYMGEAEWKAMYNQLLSSPTGKTWDDKWIGFTSEDVFGKSLEELGKLFKEDAGISPTVSKPFGKLKNIYTDSTEELPQYNEMNFGMDLTVPPDTEVLSLENGKVLSVKKDGKPLSRYGNFVEIEFNARTRMIIANLKTVDKKVKKGTILEKGQVIGTTGGGSKSYKEGDLHISLLYKGNYINPEWIITRDMKGFEDPIAGNNGGVSCLPSSSAVASPSVSAVIQEAKMHIGKPYVWGATGPNSFDCSGFMYYIMKQAGLNVNRITAKDYREQSTEIPRESIQPGDLVFWHNDTGSKHSSVYHVGLYIGDDTVIDCSTDHNGVGTRKLSSLVDKKPSRYFTFGRFAPLSGGGGGAVSSMGGCVVPGQMTDSGGYIWPVPSSKNITSKFGPRWGKNHNGLDIGAPIGTEVVASRSGEVIKVNDSCPTQGGYGSRCGGGFGNYVYLKHSDGFVSIYPHMKQGSVTPKVGDKINSGQKVGEIGNSGSSTGPHLHFEIRDSGGKAVDPLNHVKP